MILSWILGLETSVYKSFIYNLFVFAALAFFACFLGVFFVGTPVLADKLVNSNTSLVENKPAE